MMSEWEFIADPDLRDQCDHVWTADFIGYDTGLPVHAEWRCKHEGKYRKGDQVRCGYHTPGVGRKGLRRVPRDPRVSLGEHI